MSENVHLPIGTHLGGHYEIVEVLGEDNFEIIYLVKDTHRLQTFFVIKELFLKEFSTRESSLDIICSQEAENILKETKVAIISEVQLFQKNHYKKEEVQTYGYFEENNTIYTIMEFMHNAELTSYLKTSAKIENQKGSQTVKEKHSQKKRKRKSTIFLKLLILMVIIFIGLGFYTYQMIQEDKKSTQEKSTVSITTSTPKPTIHHPELTDRQNGSPKNEDNNQTKILKEVEVEKIINEEETIKEEIFIENEVEREEEVQIINIDDQLLSPIQPQEEIQNSKIISLGTKIESSNQSTQTSQSNPFEKNPISLGTPIVKEVKKESIAFSKQIIHSFLSSFIHASALGSVEDIASYYDYHVDQYFSLKNITHNQIIRDKKRYNRKWTQRSFKIINFKVLKRYIKNNINYCDIQTTTKWKVSTINGRTASGVSRGKMTLKQTLNGVKVTSIYTLK